MQIPRDMAVIGYDNIQEGLYSTPRLTTMSQPTEELGTLATRHLIGLVEGQITRTFGMRLLTPQLVIRESCGMKEFGKRAQVA